jgi:hypothetical protein
VSAAAGVTTTGGSPNALVEIQPGMWVQAVVLVDQNGQFIPAPGSVMTTLGDTLYENATPAPARLAGNTASTKKFLTQTGSGSASAAPAWGTIASGDIPASVALTGTPTAPTGTPGDASTQIATDAFVAAAVNAAVQGLSVKPSVQEATAAALPSNIYSNGSSGVGATLTGVATGVLTVDGIAVALNDRVLVKNEVAPANNGIYTCTVAGALGVAYVLTRATDMNTAAQVPGAFAFTEQGTANAGAGFTVASEGPFTIGTTAITWTQFSGAGEITAGTGLSKAGNTLSNTWGAAVLTTEGDLLYENATPVPARLAIGAVNTSLQSNGTLPSWQPAMALLAATAAAGYAKVNGTGTIISWTAPNDGNLHRVMIFGSEHVTSGETGGQITVSWTTPDGTTVANQLVSAQGSTGGYPFGAYLLVVEANATVSVRQNTALTAGAAVLWAEIWGS